MREKRVMCWRLGWKYRVNGNFKRLSYNLMLIFSFECHDKDASNAGKKVDDTVRDVIGLIAWRHVKTFNKFGCLAFSYNLVDQWTRNFIDKIIFFRNFHLFMQLSMLILDYSQLKHWRFIWILIKEEISGYRKRLLITLTLWLYVSSLCEKLSHA